MDCKNGPCNSNFRIEFDSNFPTLKNTAYLNQFNFVVYGERSGGPLDPDVANSLEAYIQQGGNLLVTGFDTLLGPDDALAALVRVTFENDLFEAGGEWEVANIDNFILKGPYGDFRGQTFDTGSNYDCDQFSPDTGAGTVVLVSIPGKSARISFNDLPGQAGSVGYWNGGLRVGEMAQPDFSDGGQPQNIFLNWAAGV